MKRWFKKYSLKEIKNDIHKYGFSYSTRDYLLQSSAIMLTIAAVAYFSRLSSHYIGILLLMGLAMTPFLIMAWFKQMYNVSRFAMLTDYLSNIIPVFMQKTKIRYTLGELADLTNGKMRSCIHEAIIYIDTTKDDPELERNALRLIEKEFPNSRVKSVHKLLLSVENMSSINYQEVLGNMYRDVEQWIKRVYLFQKELKDRRNKLLLLCALTLLMNCIFVYIYVKNDYFAGFTASFLYQLSTLLFIALILLIVTLILTRLNGEWLIDDLIKSDEAKLKAKYQLYQNHNFQVGAVFILLSAICGLLAGFFLIKKEQVAALGLLVLSAIILFEKKRKYRAAFTKIAKTIEVEFPLWLREIALNLNQLTVLNAIENSINTVSFPFRQELRAFLKEAKQDPTSIKPYNRFLEAYDLEDGRSSMKVLYSIQNLGKEEMRNRISSLIERNQEMLAKSETIRNNDSIGGIEFIGYLPIMVFSAQMLVSMFAMFAYILSSMSQAGGL